MVSTKAWKIYRMAFFLWKVGLRDETQHIDAERFAVEVYLTFSRGCTIAQVETLYSVVRSDPPFTQNALGKNCYDIKEAVPEMIATKDSVDFYWDPV